MPKFCIRWTVFENNSKIIEAVDEEDAWDKGSNFIRHKNAEIESVDEVEEPTPTPI